MIACHHSKVHLTGGSLRHFRAFPTPEQNPALGVLSRPAHPQVTQTVRRRASQKANTIKGERHAQSKNNWCDCINYWFLSGWHLLVKGTYSFGARIANPIASGRISNFY